MPRHVLIVEDEPKLATLLADYLHQAGFSSEIRSEGRSVAACVQKNPPDLILLDLMLPELDGLEVCKAVRAFSTVPIIMVTARVEEIDRLLGLGFGADDYICKPFSPREVVARVKAVLRRSDSSPLLPGPGTALHLDPERYRATLEGRDLDLTAVEFKLLALLAATPGRIYDRDQLMARIYPDQRIVCDRTIDSHIKKLRKKIAVVTADEFIHSVYSLGYKFEPPPPR